ncbi:MAG: Flp pilus assembly protein CpaB [Nitrospirae bacterium]|nr:Flp pilus assembly protein CpaB [Nitrospirota bacterium]
MDRRRMLIVVLIVAIVLAGIATFSIWSYLQSKQQEVASAKVDLMEVVAASENIPLGSTLEQRQLKKVLWPRANVPPGYFQDPGLLVGRTVVSNIFTGEPLMEAKLASGDSRSGVMAYIIPEGHRAMAVAVNDVAGVAGFVLPNSTVDVIVTTTSPQGQRISKIVLQNLRVLAVGQKMEEKEGKAIQVPTVTVSITPEEAERLALASNVGTLQLLLRGAKDNTPASTRGASTANLLSGSSRPAAAGRGTKAVSVQENEEVNITLIKSGKDGTQRTQERLVEENGFWRRSEVSK